MVDGPFKANLLNRLMAWRKAARGSVTPDTIYDVIQPIAKAADGAEDRIDRLEAIVRAYLGPQRTREIDGTEIHPSGS